MYTLLHINRIPHAFLNESAFKSNFLFYDPSQRDLKIVIVGDACVGKTSFIRRYMDGVFTENPGVSQVYMYRHLLPCSIIAPSKRVWLGGPEGTQTIHGHVYKYYNISNFITELNTVGAF